MTLFEGLSRISTRFERSRQHADHVGVIAKHGGNRLADVLRLCSDAKDPVSLVVDQRESGVARDRQHAVAHARDDVAVERVGGRRARVCRAEAVGGGGPTRFGTHLVRTGGTPSGGART
jgi:hypothetical protein